MTFLAQEAGKIPVDYKFYTGPFNWKLFFEQSFFSLTTDDSSHDCLFELSIVNSIAHNMATNCQN